MKVPLNAIIGFINTVIGGINKLSFDVPEIKGITKGFRVGFDIPKIPELASGGLAYGPTLAMIGEGRDREAVLPLNQSVYAEIAKGISSSGNPVIATLLEKSCPPSNRSIQISAWTGNPWRPPPLDTMQRRSAASARLS